MAQIYEAVRQHC